MHGVSLSGWMSPILARDSLELMGVFLLQFIVVALSVRSLRRLK
jgi:hypothetical protein